MWIWCLKKDTKPTSTRTVLRTGPVAGPLSPGRHAVGSGKGPVKLVEGAAMLNAVWVAVIVAVAFWVALVCAAVYVMAKAARLVSQTTATVASLGERQDLLIERANATIDRASEQLVKTDEITASMDEVTANMAELTGRMTALAPLAKVIGASAGSPMAKIAALAYGVNRALWMRRPAGAARPPAAGARALSRGQSPGRRQLTRSGHRDGTAS
jgi:hypothetical protein